MLGGGKIENSRATQPKARKTQQVTCRLFVRRIESLELEHQKPNTSRL